MGDVLGIPTFLQEKFQIHWFGTLLISNCLLPVGCGSKFHVEVSPLLQMALSLSTDEIVYPSGDSCIDLILFFSINIHCGCWSCPHKAF